MPRALRAAVVLLPALLAAMGRAEVANRIVATVDGEPITAHEVRRYAREHGLSADPDPRVLDALITDKLLQTEIKAQGITARDEEVDRYIEEIRTRNGMGEDQFRDALGAQGLSMDQYRARVKAEIEKAQLVNREIRQRVNVSPEEIQRWYDAHAADYATPERVKVRDIFFGLEAGAEDADVARTRAKALEVRALALAGRDFGALARQFSEGPGAEKGGELGTFGRGEMERELEQAAFTLEAGQVSEPIRTAAGLHLLRVDARLAGGHRPLDEVKDEIRETLYNQALEQRFENWMSRDLRERHHVEVLD